MPEHLTVYLVGLLWAASLASLLISYEHYVSDPGPITPLKTWWLNFSIVATFGGLLALFSVVPD